MKHRFDHILAFISGDIPVMIAAWIHIQWDVIILKLVITLLIGIVGGFSGLLGKELFRFTKKKLFKSE